MQTDVRSIQIAMEEGRYVYKNEVRYNTQRNVWYVEIDRKCAAVNQSIKMLIKPINFGRNCI